MRRNRLFPHHFLIIAGWFAAGAAPGFAAALAHPAPAIPDTGAIRHGKVPVYSAPGVEVTASRYGQDDRLNVSNVTAGELARREPDQDLPLLVQSQPGVFSYSDAGGGLGYTYLKVRGFDQRRVGVLLDGIPLNDPEDHQVWWVDMPDLASDVQDIQLQRGVTGSVGGMTAIGGTVDIVTTPPGERPGTRVALDTGSYAYRRQMLAWDSGRGAGGWATAIRLSRQETAGYRDRSGHEGWAVAWSARRTTARTIDQVGVQTGRELSHHAWDAVPESILAVDRTANMETYHNAVDDFRQPHYQWHHTWFVNDRLTLVSRLYHVRGDGFYENYKAGQSAENYALDLLPGGPATGDNVDLIRRKWVSKRHTGWVPSLVWEQGRGRLLLGGDAYTFHSDHWGEVLWAGGFTPDAFTTPLRYHEYTGDKKAWSLYADERWGLGGGLQATANLQYQRKRYTFAQDAVGNFAGDRLNRYTVTDGFFNPKGALDWAVPGAVAGGRLLVYANMGVNHREPTDSELFDTWTGGDDLGAQPLFGSRREVSDGHGGVAYVEWSDPLVKPERVVDREFGLGWRGRSLAWSLGGYWMDFTNEIVPYGGVSDDGSGIRGNAGRTRHRGLEFSARAQLGASHVVSVTASRSWDEAVEFIFHDWDGAVYDNAGKPLALFPEYLAMAVWDGQWGEAVRSRLRVRGTGRQWLDNSGLGDRTIDSWTTLDASLWLDLRKAGFIHEGDVSVFAHLRNLADARYETWGYWYGENWKTPAAGRNVAVGIDCGF